MKRSPLRRRSPLRSRRKPPPRLSEPGRVEWKTQKAGRCQCGCHRFSMHLHHHHVYPERLVRMAGGDPWAERNGMYLADRCHMNHHSAFRRIPVESVPDAALAFLVDLIGEDKAVLFFSRFYGGGLAVPFRQETAR